MVTSNVPYDLQACSLFDRKTRAQASSPNFSAKHSRSTFVPSCWFLAAAFGRESAKMKPLSNFSSLSAEEGEGVCDTNEYRERILQLATVLAFWWQTERSDNKPISQHSSQ